MQAIKSKNTKIEEMLAKALEDRGLQFVRNDSDIFGKPDFSFAEYKIAVFCDGEFFHGKNWGTQKYRIKTNVAFWQKKIGQNIKRDILVNDTLKENGWKVIRFWGEDIKKNLDLCVGKIETVIEERKLC